jgi:nucleoside-diphosphate-sugar epimerase
VKPSYAYGISKLQCETGLQTLEDETFKPIVFRKGTVGGWSPKMRYDLVVNTMLKTAFTTGKIVVNNPKIWRPLIDIRDVIQGYERAIEADPNVSGVFNLSGQNMTIGNLGELITEELNSRNYSVELIINENNDVRNYKVSTEKIEDELNFKSRFTVMDSVYEILDNVDPTCYDFNREEFSNIATFQKVLQK